MKNKFTVFLGVLLCAALLLTGCGNSVKKIEAEIAAIEASYAAPAAVYDGGEVTIGEAMGDLNSAYSACLSYGYAPTAQDIYSFMQGALEYRLRLELAAEHFDSDYSLTEEELSALKTEAEAQYDSLLQQALSSAEGKGEREKQANAEAMLHRIGMDAARISDKLLLERKSGRMEEKVRAEIAGLSEAELQAAYEAKLSENEEGYADGSSFVELDMLDGETVVCYVPEGYRRVKHVLLIPSEQVQADYISAMYALEDAEEALAVLEEELQRAEDDDTGAERSEDEVKKDIAAAEEQLVSLKKRLEGARALCLADTKLACDEIYARLEAGESFDALIAEYGEDPGMLKEPAASRGYYVSAASVLWDTAFRDNAMAIANPGEYSQPVVSANGVHIICYVEDARAGAVPLDEVRDALYAETLEDAQAKRWEETVSGWVEARNPSYDLDAFAAVFMQQEKQ